MIHSERNERYLLLVPVTETFKYDWNESSFRWYEQYFGELLSPCNTLLLRVHGSLSTFWNMFLLSRCFLNTFSVCLTDEKMYFNEQYSKQIAEVMYFSWTSEGYWPLWIWWQLISCQVYFRLHSFATHPIIFKLDANFR